MSATLVFDHDGWTVVSTAWTAASRKKGEITVCYSWSVLPSMGLLASSTGVERVEIEIDMADFLDRVKQGGVVDFRRIPRRVS